MLKLWRYWPWKTVSSHLKIINLNQRTIQMEDTCLFSIFELTYLLYFHPRSLTTIQDAKRMSVKIHFTGYRTAHLQIYNWLMYTYIKGQVWFTWCLELLFLFSEEEGGWGIIVYYLGRILLRLLYGFLHELRRNENAHADIVIFKFLVRFWSLFCPAIVVLFKDSIIQVTFTEMDQPITRYTYQLTEVLLQRGHIMTISRGASSEKDIAKMPA